MFVSNDLAQALRTLWRRPVQSAIVVSIIAAGVGASSAFYSVSDSLLLRPLPFDNAERLLSIEKQEVLSHARLLMSRQELNALREASKTLEDVAVFQLALGSITAGGTQNAAEGISVDYRFLPLLNVSPALGRGFLAEDEQPGAPCAMILGDAFWRHHFAADPSILGKTVPVNTLQLRNKLCVVIGVMPRSFYFPFAELTSPQEDFLLPLSASPAALRYGDKYGIARLLPDVSLRQAQAEALAVASRLDGGAARPDSETFVLRRYREAVVEEYVPMLALLGAVLVCVLAVVSVNIAGLLLVETARNTKDLAIRVALGGSKWQTVRAVAYRVVALALCGGLASLGLAWALVRVVCGLLPDGFPSADQISVSPHVVCFAFGVALATGVLAGFWPVVAAARNLHRLSPGGQSRAERLRALPRFQVSLVVMQLALSGAFLIVTALLTMSLYRLTNVDSGIKLDHRLAVVLRPADTSLRPADLDAFFSEIDRKFLAAPGVEEVAMSSDLPMGTHATRSFSIRDAARPGKPDQLVAQADAVDLNYFRTLGIAMHRGRPFDRGDRAGGKPVAIVNELFAKRFLGAQSPLGAQICTPDQDGCLWREIVGVVADARDGRLDTPPEPAFFVPVAQAPGGFLTSVVFTVHAAMDPGLLRATVEKHMSDWAPGAVLMTSFTLDEMRSLQAVAPRARVLVLAAIAFLSLLLAAIGVYGTIAEIVEQRRREIGIRIALGASEGMLAWLFIRRMLLALIPGIAIGAAVAATLIRGVASVLFETSPLDPVAYAVALLVLSSTAVLATLLPVRSALRVSAGALLRAE
ncbi:MAG: ABC transporter permease [Bryobacteraceae bacterium]|jgi:putative ABC transport system permease protein